MPPTAANPKKSQPVPAPRKNAPSSLSGFRRVQIGLNVILQILLLAFCLTLINYYAYKHFKRFDFSHDHKYALSPTTKKSLASLNKKTTITIFMSRQVSLIYDDVYNLANEYRIAQPKFVSIEQVDPFRDAGRAAEVQAKYKLAQRDNVVIVESDGHNRIIADNEMADVEAPNPMLGQQTAQITAFKGEQAITGALIEVTEGKQSIAYYLRGHGEPDAKLKDSPLETLRLLETQHVNFKELNLLNEPAIPADAGLVMIIGPSYDLSEGEAKKLNEYWEKNGRILLLLDPNAQTPRLSAFLEQAGIQTDDDRLIGAVRMAGVSRLTRDTVGEFTGGGTIAQNLQGLNVILLGATQSLTLNPSRASQAKLKLDAFLQAMPGYWGETDYRSLEDPEAASPVFDAGKDKKEPLTIMASVERGAVGDQNVQLGSARMIVAGNARFVRRDSMDEAGANLFLSSVNWLLARDALVGIAPKQAKTFTLNLSENQVQSIFLMSVLALPGFFALLGVLVWWRRRA